MVDIRDNQQRVGVADRREVGEVGNLLDNYHQVDVDNCLEDVDNFVEGEDMVDLGVASLVVVELAVRLRHYLVFVLPRNSTCNIGT